MPVFMCVYAWGDIIFNEFTGNEHMILDGTPRKLEEARMLESVFPFFDLPKPWVIYLDIDHDETKRRITIRAKGSGRADDNDKALENRRVAYEEDVKPTVDWYRSHAGVNFLDIDGERSIEEIHTDIVKKLGLV
jgi:adenylate kinase